MKRWHEGAVAVPRTMQGKVFLSRLAVCTYLLVSR